MLSEEGFRPLELRAKMEGLSDFKCDLGFEFGLIIEEGRVWNFRRLGRAPNAMTKQVQAQCLRPRERERSELL